MSLKDLFLAILLNCLKPKTQNFRQSYMLWTDQIEIHQSQPASMTYSIEGLKVTLVAVIGGFPSDLSITRKTAGNFDPLVFCFPKSRINENGGKLCILQCLSSSKHLR